MSESLRLAAVQAAPVFLDRDATVEKACRLVREAGASGTAVIGFPEGFIPAHPLWYHFYPASSPKAFGFAQRLSDQAIEVPGRVVDLLAEAARDAGVFVVMGCCERLPDRPGTLFNTLLFIDSDGRLVGRHRKLVPTLGEQLVHAPGDSTGLKTYRSAHGPLVSGLMCGENSNPLATFALDAQGTNVHVAAWPSHFNVGVDMRDIVPMVTRSLAYQLKAYVINAIGSVSPEMLQELPVSDEHRRFLEAQDGGATIMGPWGQVLAGPMPPGEGILYGDVDLDDLTVPKLIQDFGGHYNRFDLLHMEVRPGGYAPLHVEGGAPGSSPEDPAPTRPALTGSGRRAIEAEGTTSPRG